MFRKVFLGSAGGLCYTTILMTCSVIQSALAVRFLPKADAGVWFILLNIATFLAFFDFGLSPTLSREIGFAKRKPDPNRRIANVYGTINLTITYAASLLAVLGLLITAAYFYYVLPHSAWQKLMIALVIFVIGVAIRLMSNPKLAAIYGMGYVGTERMLRACGPIIGTSLSFLLLLAGYGLKGMCIAWLCQCISVFILSKVRLSWEPFVHYRGKFLPVAFWRLLTPSFKWAVMNFSAFFILQIGNIVIAAVLGVKAVPQYSVLMQIASAILLLSSLLQIAITPFVSISKGQGNHDLVRRMFFLCMNISMAFVIMLAAFFTFYCKEVIALWLGPHFIFNPKVMYILLLTTIFEVQHVSAATVAMAAGYVEFAWPAIIAAILNVLLSVFLVTKLGITGAALSILFVQLMTNNWYVVYASCKYLAVSWQQFIYHYLVKTLIYAAILFVIAYELHSMTLHDINSTWLRCVMGMLGVGVCGLICFYLLMTNRDKRFIREKSREMVTT